MLFYEITITTITETHYVLRSKSNKCIKKKKKDVFDYLGASGSELVGPVIE